MHGFISCVCVCVCVYVCIYTFVHIVCKLITHIHSIEADTEIIRKELWKTERYVHVSKTECNIQGD